MTPYEAAEVFALFAEAEDFEGLFWRVDMTPGRNREMKLFAQCSDFFYAYLFPGKIASTVEARSDINVDIDADRTVLGVEVIGNADWTDGLVALAMAGRLPGRSGQLQVPAELGDNRELPHPM